MAIKNNLASTSSTELNFLGSGSRLEGALNTESSVRVDGVVKGKLICKNTLTVGINGEIEGEIEAKNAIIGGKIKGKIIVTEKLVLESKAVLIGDLKASKLIIDEGAVFDGTSLMRKTEPSPTPARPETPIKEPGK